MALVMPGNFVQPPVSGSTEVNLMGLHWGVIEETVTPDGSGSYNLTSKLPQYAVVMAATVKTSATVVATTAVKIGLGTSGDTDKYALTSDLTAKTSKQTIISNVPVVASTSAAETVQVGAASAAGAAAGTLDSGGDITVRLTYYVEGDL